MALLTQPGGLVIFFHSGPFAWKGMLAFWLPMAVYGIWYPTMFLALRKSIQEESHLAPKT